MIEVLPPLGKYKYDTWRILPMKCYIDISVRLRSCIWNVNIGCRCHTSEVHNCQLLPTIHVVAESPPHQTSQHGFTFQPRTLSTACWPLRTLPGISGCSHRLPPQWSLQPLHQRTGLHQKGLKVINTIINKLASKTNKTSTYILQPLHQQATHCIVTNAFKMVGHRHSVSSPSIMPEMILAVEALTSGTTAEVETSVNGCSSA
jgi:hypothetical protein